MGYVSLTVLIFGTLKFCDTWESPFISILLLIPTMILKMDPIFFFEPSFPFHAVSFIKVKCRPPSKVMTRVWLTRILV